MKVSVIIPTLCAEKFLPSLLKSLADQKLMADQIIIIDSSSPDNTISLATAANCTVKVIPRDEFDHGGTRNLGASLAVGDILVFMTQDALPADDRFLDELTKPIRQGTAAACYARQIAAESASPLEKFAREFNYPPDSHTRTIADVDRFGVKAFFSSNVASAVLKSDFELVGRFPAPVLLSEDMALSGKLLHAGKAVAYQANACVYHSHSYGIIQQFKRYFDTGAAFRKLRPSLGNIQNEGEGLRFAWSLLRYLVRTGNWAWLPRSVFETVVKYTGYRMGYLQEVLPTWLVRKCSMHAYFWSRLT